jgi:thymidylate synthase (FAD)
MRIIRPTYTIPPLEREAIEQAPARIEHAARVCYASTGKGRPEEFVRARLRSGHLPVLRQATFGVLFTCSRSAAQQLLRHAHLDPMMESQRYVRYRELEFITPFDGDPPAWWVEARLRNEQDYLEALRQGHKPEVARTGLPMCTATRLWISTNCLQWRHLFAARCTPEAEPEVRRLCTDLRDELVGLQPCVFSA